jgi:hypothetical protein
MTRDQARIRARKRSREEMTDYYVVTGDEPGQYDVASDFDLDTFYLGQPILDHYFGGEMQ